MCKVPTIAGFIAGFKSAIGTIPTVTVVGKQIGYIRC